MKREDETDRVDEQPAADCARAEHAVLLERWLAGEALSGDEGAELAACEVCGARLAEFESVAAGLESFGAMERERALDAPPSPEARAVEQAFVADFLAAVEAESPASGAEAPARSDSPVDGAGSDARASGSSERALDSSPESDRDSDRESSAHSPDGAQPSHGAPPSLGAHPSLGADPSRGADPSHGTVSSHGGSRSNGPRAFGPARWLVAAAAVLLVSLSLWKGLAPDEPHPDPGQDYILSGSEGAFELFAPLGEVREYGVFRWEAGSGDFVTYRLEIRDATDPDSPPIRVEVDSPEWTPDRPLPDQIEWTVRILDIMGEPLRGQRALARARRASSD